MGPGTHAPIEILSIAYHSTRRGNVNMSDPLMTEHHDPKAHLLVVDDDARIRDLLKAFLMENGYAASTAEDAAHARRLLNAIDFDLLIVDVMMPGEDGLAFTESLRETTQTPIMLLTARDLPEDRIEGLRAGADDYLAKPFEPEELVLRTEAILRRAAPSTAPSAVTFGPCRFEPQSGILTKDGEAIRLTSAEIALLTVLAARPGQVISRAALATRTSAGQERSVDVQVTRLRRKIETDPREPQYLQTIRGAGYRLLASGDG